MRVVNLCFHGIGTPRRDLELGEDVYWISPDSFYGILDLVSNRPDVRLSFDDGNASDVEIAFRELQARGLTATFFIVTGRLGSPGSLTSEDVRHLHAAGMPIGNHGMTHRPWRGMNPGEFENEAVTARKYLADLTGTAVRDAALPLGRYDRALLARLRNLDYRSIQTSDRRWARPDAWLQARYSIRRDDTPSSVARELLRPPPVAARAKGTLVGAAKRIR